MTTDYGVEYAYPNGRTIIGSGYTLDGARAMVASDAPIYPKPTRVMCCERTAWLPVDEAQEGTTE